MEFTLLEETLSMNKEILILDQYSNTPSYRIGLYINEEIVNANLDESLNDNSQGYNNYAAPGADRLKISVFLLKKSLDDFNDDNFIELATVVNGVLRTKTQKGGLGGGVGYKDWTDTLARRTYDESGDYYVRPFDVSVVDSRMIILETMDCSRQINLHTVEELLQMIWQCTESLLVKHMFVDMK